MGQIMATKLLRALRTIRPSYGPVSFSIKNVVKTKVQWNKNATSIIIHYIVLLLDLMLHAVENLP